MLLRPWSGRGAVCCYADDAAAASAAPLLLTLHECAGGVFKLELFLPEDYPMAPPKVGQQHLAGVAGWTNSKSSSTDCRLRSAAEQASNDFSNLVAQQS